MKTFLDFNAAPVFVRYLSWLPVRNIFRDKPIRLAGDWEHIWGAGGSEGFLSPVDRHGHPTLYQLGSFCYAEFDSQRVKYAFFGKIRGANLNGDWFDVKDRDGYFGVFQLEIINSSSMRGSWLGHSKTTREIRSDTSMWTRVPS
jgi:hypothetical protein